MTQKKKKERKDFFFWAENCAGNFSCSSFDPQTAPIVHVMVRRGGTALEQGRGLSPGGAISKWEPPAMTSPLSVNHLCLISPPGALQSKYQCGRPTKTVSCIRRITQAARVLHHPPRRFNYLSEAKARRQLRTMQKSHRGEEEEEVEEPPPPPHPGLS